MRRAAVLAIAAALACATRPEPVDPGELADGVYRNVALDLRVSPPPGWAFVSRADLEASVRTAYTGEKAAKTIELERETTLFTMVDRATQPAPGRARRSVTAHAQSVPDPPPDVSSEMLAAELERTLRVSETPITIGPRRQAIVAGRRFVVVSTEVTGNGLRGRLDHYVRYEAGRMIVLTFSYPPEDAAPPQAAVEAIRPLASKGTP